MYPYVFENGDSVYRFTYRVSSLEQFRSLGDGELFRRGERLSDDFGRTDGDLSGGMELLPLFHRRESRDHDGGVCDCKENFWDEGGTISRNPGVCKGIMNIFP